MECRAKQHRENCGGFGRGTLAIAGSAKIIPYQLTGLEILGFRFSSPVRRRVAQAGQGISARTDETTSHSTKLSKDDSQVAGYQGERSYMF
jgi:hypothetical protein